MEDVVLKFDPKDSGANDKIFNVTLKARSGNDVKLCTHHVYRTGLDNEEGNHTRDINGRIPY
jgi:hypothetical protein